MSGGHFDYVDHHFNDVADTIQDDIAENNIPWEYSFGDSGMDYFHENGDQRYSDKTMEIFEKGLEYVRIAAIYAHEIDYLLSGDTGEDGMQDRIDAAILKMRNNNFRTPRYDEDDE